MTTKIFPDYETLSRATADLIKDYKNKDINWASFQFLPLEIAAIVKGLSNKNIKDRLQLLNCDFKIFLAQKCIKEINYSLLYMKTKITEQVILCQFINYLI